MVFIGGPRQVGKTTLAKELLKKYYKDVLYLLWDNRKDRKDILSSNWTGSANLIVLDEIHKYKNWKSYIKGEYDKLKDKYKFVVTGSSRLDIFRKGGDSLQGRYHYYRLHPFTLAEVLGISSLQIKPFNEIKIAETSSNKIFDSLEHFGGFPEPFIRQNDIVLRRWHNEKIERFFREDIRDLEPVRDMSSIKILSDMLCDKVGGLLSVNSIREDLEVSHKAVKHWLEILESFYYIFRIYPYTKTNYKSLKKEPKVFLWDWSEVDDEAKRFENMIASHLLKFVHFFYDNQGYKININFLRDLEKREVDFLISVDNKPWFGVEVKLSEEEISPNLFYFKEKLKIPYNYQVVKKRGVDRYKEGIRVISAERFLTALI
jgi:predicted AAA+ superfamily ATPase